MDLHLRGLRPRPTTPPCDAAAAACAAAGEGHARLGRPPCTPAVEGSTRGHDPGLVNGAAYPRNAMALSHLDQEEDLL